MIIKKNNIIKGLYSIITIESIFVTKSFYNFYKLNQGINILGNKLPYWFIGLTCIAPVSDKIFLFFKNKLVTENRESNSLSSMIEERNNCNND